MDAGCVDDGPAHIESSDSEDGDEYDQHLDKQLYPEEIELIAQIRGMGRSATRTRTEDDEDEENDVEDKDDEDEDNADGDEHDEGEDRARGRAQGR